MRLAYSGHHRVRCRRTQKVCLHSGAPEDPVEGLGLSVVSRVSPYEEAEESVLETRR